MSNESLVFPTLEEFKIFLEDEQDSKLTSGLKSMFVFISKYFAEKEFNKANFRYMLHELRIGYVYKAKPLKKATLNKYIQTGNLIAKYLNLPFKYKQYRNVDEESKPFGDLLSDAEMEKIASLYVPRHYANRIEADLTNLKFQASFTCMRFTGIPPVDLCNLKWDQDKVTHFEYRRQKTGKHMIVPIVPQLRELLDKLPHHSHEYIFATALGRMKESTLNIELRKRADFLKIQKHVTCYSFRYSMITWCYINAGEGMIPKLSKITGHTVQTAMKHYAKFDSSILIDALYATHPGLRGNQTIDTIKRIAINLLKNLVDFSKYEVKLEIMPKKENERKIRLS